ncbi:MAG: Oxidoreductase [Labilithrix sp.]|nr:Oxidoreductase [Labilithrix sp.]
METAIPTVDLADLRASDPARLEAASQALRTAFGTYGLAYVKNHGVDADGLARVYDEFRTITQRPEAEKRKLARPDLWFQRGWTPPNTEVAVASGGQPDFKECYFMAPYEADPALAAQYPELFPDNVWPEGMGVFRAEYMKLGKALHEAGLALLRGAAHALGLPVTTFTDICENGAHVTRVLHYLGLDETQVARGTLWGEEHTDFNLLTLLPGGRFVNPAGVVSPKPDDKSGLFLRTRGTAEHPEGIQVRGRPPEGCIVAQIGQQLEILTGGVLVATPHVITAPGVTGWTRDSAAHFIHANASRVLFPLEPFQTDAARAAYRPPVLAGTYSIKTLVDIGLAPRTALDALGYRHYDRLAAQRSVQRPS